MKILIGLTGGIAGGKTTVSDYLQKKEITIIDADVISRMVVQKGSEGALKLQQIFPSAFDGDNLNRSKLRKIIFEDSNSRNQLNAIVHPLIAEEIKRQYDEVSDGIIVLSAPLLYEAGLHKLTKKVITVSCPENKRILRIIFRDNINKELAQKMIGAQISDSVREKYAQYVIHNDGTLENLYAQVDEVFRKIKVEMMAQGKKLAEKEI